MHVAQNKFLSIAKMIAIHLMLVFVNVVGKNNPPASSLQSNPHQANACEKFSECFLAYAHRCCRIFAPLRAALNTDLTRLATRTGVSSECSQTRKTCQPFCRKPFRTNKSRF